MDFFNNLLVPMLPHRPGRRGQVLPLAGHVFCEQSEKNARSDSPCAIDQKCRGQQLQAPAATHRPTFEAEETRDTPACINCISPAHPRPSLYAQNCVHRCT